MNEFDSKVIKLYTQQNMSTYAIAKKLNTYAKKVARTLQKHGYSLKSKSEAQKQALKSGRSNHPTQGKNLSENTKLKISESQGKVWDSLSENQRKSRSDKARQAWENKTPREKEDFLRQAAIAVREAAETGSKLEKYLLNELIERKYKVEFHKEKFLRNVKFHVDLFLPELRTVIEVDGAPHHKKIWSEEYLNRKRYSDQQKNGLVLGSGLVMIRIRQDKPLSDRYQRKVLMKLIQTLNSISQKFPSETERYIEL